MESKSQEAKQKDTVDPKHAQAIKRQRERAQAGRDFYPARSVQKAAAACNLSCSQLKELAKHPSFSFLPMNESVLARLAAEEK